MIDMKLIVHPGTATIVRADECVVVDLDSLELDALTEHIAQEIWEALEEGDDLEVAKLAEQVGTPVVHENVQ